MAARCRVATADQPPGGHNAISVLAGGAAFPGRSGNRSYETVGVGDSPQVALLFSLVAKLVVPTTTVFVVATIVTAVTDDIVIVQMLLGLALVAAMPAAGSSPAWTQTAGGDVALSLGIVVGSTLLGPWFGGIWLSNFAQQAGQIDQNLVRQIAAAIFGSFFLWWVLIPSILGIVCRYLLGRQRITKLRPLDPTDGQRSATGTDLCFCRQVTSCCGSARSSGSARLGLWAGNRLVPDRLWSRLVHGSVSASGTVDSRCDDLRDWNAQQRDRAARG